MVQAIGVRNSDAREDVEGTRGHLSDEGEGVCYARSARGLPGLVTMLICDLVSSLLSSESFIQVYSQDNVVCAWKLEILRSKGPSSSRTASIPKFGLSTIQNGFETR